MSFWSEDNNSCDKTFAFQYGKTFVCTPELLYSYTPFNYLIFSSATLLASASVAI